jgi:gliding-associated putative ABC transporter substrate-binding component GldG
MEKKRLTMAEKLSDKNIKTKSWLQFLTASGVIFLIAALSSMVNIRLDLTEDKRFTLSDPTIKVLTELENDIYIQVYLYGEIPIPLKRMRRSVNELLEEFRIASGRKIDYEFINPSDGKDIKQRQTQYQALINKGLAPVNIQSGDTEGGSIQKIIFPGMIVNYNGIEVPVNFLKNNPSIPYEQNILHSIEGLEYEMIQTIATVSSDTIYKVAFIEGHSEISEIETADITFNLAKFFTIDRGTIDGKPGVLDNYSAIIIAGPETEFTEPDKFVLDQYIMNGGKVLWLIDAVSVNSDSLAYGETAGLYRTLNIEDQLFRYGARVNAEIVQDLECMMIRLKVSTGSQQQYVPVPWVYYPLLIPSPEHPITRNLNRIKGEFTGYLDTVGLDSKIRKKVLLTTSDLSRTISPPVLITLKEAEITHDVKEFNKPRLPVAVLLEGVFPSAFRNRMTGNLPVDKNFKTQDESISTKMIVIADGDIIRNEVKRTGLKETPLTLGQDKYTGQVFGNRDFLVNCLNYLVDDNGLMELRSRELKLRMLNKSMIKSGRLKWQIINIVSPVLIVVIAGLLFSYIRRRIYTGF